MHKEIQTLKKRTEFLKALSLSYRTSSVIVQCNPESQKLGFGFTASRRIGNAVTRNRAKRRLRAVVLWVKRSYNLTPFHWVFIARSSCINTPFISLKKDIVLGINKCLEKSSKSPIVNL